MPMHDGCLAAFRLPSQCREFKSKSPLEMNQAGFLDNPGDFLLSHTVTGPWPSRLNLRFWQANATDKVYESWI